MSYFENITAINNRLANFDAAFRSYERTTKNLTAVSDSLKSVYRPAIFNHLGVDMSQHFKALQMPFPSVPGYICDISSYKSQQQSLEVEQQRLATEQKRLVIEQQKLEELKKQTDYIERLLEINRQP